LSAESAGLPSAVANGKLTNERERKLRAHLRSGLDETQTERIVRVARCACSWTVAERLNGPWWRDVTAQARSEYRRQFARIGSLAAELRDVLLETGDGDVHRDEWYKRLSAELKALGDEATREAQRLTRKPGSPDSHHWRHSLIRAVYEAFPPGKAKKTMGSHFEMTVALLLTFVDPASLPEANWRERVHRYVTDGIKQSLAPTLRAHLERLNQVG
jgi:hypothetical protein